MCWDVVAKIRSIELKILELEQEKLSLSKINCNPEMHQEYRQDEDGVNKRFQVIMQCITKSDDLVCVKCIVCGQHIHLPKDSELIPKKVIVAQPIKIDMNKCIKCKVHIKNPNYNSNGCEHQLPE